MKHLHITSNPGAEYLHTDSFSPSHTSSRPTYSDISGILPAIKDLASDLNSTLTIASALCQQTINVSKSEITVYLDPLISFLLGIMG